MPEVNPLYLKHDRRLPSLVGTRCISTEIGDGPQLMIHFQEGLDTPDAVARRIWWFATDSVWWLHNEYEIIVGDDEIQQELDEHGHATYTGRIDAINILVGKIVTNVSVIKPYFGVLLDFEDGTVFSTYPMSANWLYEPDLGTAWQCGRVRKETTS